MMIEIRHLEWITVTADGRKVLGYNQEWYPEKRQKLAGCGPTVGAMIAAYVEMKEWQMPVTTKEGATSKMLDIWKYATPRMHGLYKTRWLKEGLEAYMKERGLKGTPEAMPIPPIHMLAPSFEKLKNFIAEGLASDCPVGFLNLHSGGEPIPYHWHWMPLVKIEKEMARPSAPSGTKVSRTSSTWRSGSPIRNLAAASSGSWGLRGN